MKEYGAPFIIYYQQKAADKAIHDAIELEKEQHLHIGHGCSLDPTRGKK